MQMYCTRSHVHRPLPVLLYEAEYRVRQKIPNSSIRQVISDSTPTAWSQLQGKELKLADETNTKSNKIAYLAIEQ